MTRRQWWSGSRTLTKLSYQWIEELSLSQGFSTLLGKMSSSELLSPLQESLLILTVLANWIKWTLSPVTERGSSKELKFVLTHYAIVLLTSFLEEWKRLKGLGKDARIQNALRIALPAIKRIQRWKGLSDYRNVAAAHAHRDKDKKFVPWPEALDIHKVPSSYAEIVILGNCAIETITELTNEFSEEFAASKPRLKAILPVPVRRGFRIRELVELELAEVQRQMELERSKIKKKGTK